MKESEWINVSQKPKSVGIYKRKYIDGEEGWQYWNGKFWCLWQHINNTGFSFINRISDSFFQEGFWKGVIEDE